jgi:hypothetical protein
MANSTYDIKSYDFRTIEEEYKDKIGKTESLYTVVLFNCGAETLLEYTLSRSQNAQKIKDSHRRARARKAYYNLKEFGEAVEENAVLNHLIMMDVEKDQMDIYALTSSITGLLSAYECDDIWVRCTDHHNLVELRDYLESDEYFDMFRVRNNKVSHIKLGRTKRVVIHSEESKSLILPDYVESRLDSQSKYLAYGVSSKLAALNSAAIRDRAYDVMNYDVTDSDAIEFIHRMEQSDILDEMDTDYEMIHNPKTMHRLIFKKDFKPDKIAILKRIYIDQRMLEKFKQNCEKGGIDISFEVVVIDHNIKDFQEGRELRLWNEFNGVVGVTYY